MDASYENRHSSDQLWLPGPLPRSAGTCSRDVRESVLRHPVSGAWCQSFAVWCPWVACLPEPGVTGLFCVGLVVYPMLAHVTKWAFCFPHCAAVCEYCYFSGFPQETNLVKEDNHQNRKWTHVFNNTKRLCSFVTRVWDNFCKPLSFSLFSILIYIWLLKRLNVDCILREDVSVISVRVKTVLWGCPFPSCLLYLRLWRSCGMAPLSFIIPFDIPFSIS